MRTAGKKVFFKHLSNKALNLVVLSPFPMRGNIVVGKIVLSLVFVRVYVVVSLGLVLLV